MSQNLPPMTAENGDTMTYEPSLSPLSPQSPLLTMRQNSSLQRIVYFSVLVVSLTVLNVVVGFQSSLSPRPSRLLCASTAEEDDDDNARSAFGTKQYWNDVYTGMGDFPQDEYSWYYGWEIIKPFFTKAVPSKDARILLPGIGNDGILLDLWKSNYRNLVAFDYSEHAVERQHDLLTWEPQALEHVQVLQRNAKDLDEDWTDSFDAILEKGALDAIYLSGDGNVEQAVAEFERVLKPGGIVVSVSGVVPSELRQELFDTSRWKWIRDGSDDLKAGCFVLMIQ